MTDVHVVLPQRPIETIEEYLDAGGGEGLRAARALGPEGTIDEIAAAGLRGRGGAGFSTAAKWASVRSGPGSRRYVVANGAEGEPATFKDRALLRRDPYRVVEGAAIAAIAVGADDMFLATKRSYEEAAANLRRAAEELAGAGLLGNVSVTVVEGPGEYLFGEEKALLEVIEGHEPLPRLLPPWQHGLFATAPSGGWEAESAGVTDVGESNPTVVNNVETLAAAAHILGRGANWFRSMGTDESPGTVIVTIVGDVVAPGVHEVELGTPLSDVLALCGGPRPGRVLRAAFSGVSNPVLPAEDFEVPLSYEGLAACGSGLGAAGFAIYDDTADMVDVARTLSRFLAVESCGQCPPCKRESIAITDQLDAIIEGRADDTSLAQIGRSLQLVTDANRCYLGTQEQNVVSSIMRTFPEDFALHLEGSAVSQRRVQVPLVADITDAGEVVYDESHARKQLDWTYRAVGADH
jgi:NADH:ubiquinone oxidoreductase subunit F (NADH-binding)